MTRLRAFAVALCVSSGVAGCGGHSAGHPVAAGPGTPAPTTAPTPTTPPTTTAPHRPARVKVAAETALTPFSSCPALLSAVRSEAENEVTAYGLGGGGATPVDRAAGAPMPAAAGAAASGNAASGAVSEGATAAGPSTASSGSPAFSTTNDQEAGVDEPDLAKTNGSLMVVLRNSNVVQVVQVGGSVQSNRGALMLPGEASGLFLVGSDVVALGSSVAYGGGVVYPGGGVAYGPGGGGAAVPPGVPTNGGTVPGGDSVAPTPANGAAIAVGGPAVAPYPSPYPSPSASSTPVWVVSVANPDHLVLTRTFTVTGNVVDARLIGHSVKLVTESQPQIVFPVPQDYSSAGLAKAAAANRGIIAKAPLSAWLPSVTQANGTVQPTDCGNVDHTVEPEGVGMLSVVTLDPDKTAPQGMVSVLGNAGTTYASLTNLYVATENYALQQEMAAGPATGVAGERTVIHDFSISDPHGATYVGSGTVPGVLLNQFAMSEYNGDLRVATTSGFPSPPPFEGGPVPAADGSQSYVTVLRPSSGALAQVGQVGGLGVTQKIYGVRFVGALGYVVTFMQMDPLYVVDLSDPAHPAVRGALELTGYSAYLNTAGPGLLLGVGEAATANGSPQGMQVSLFDVRDSNHPRLVGQDVIQQATALVSNDPHAFLWWEPTHLALIPADSYESAYGSVAYAFHVDSVGGVTKVAELTHGGRGGTGQPNIERAIVVGKVLYTISDAGVLASNLNSFSDVAWTSFPPN